MKRMTWVLLVLTLASTSPVRAQMGMDLFKRPGFTKVFRPVVGQGAEYQIATDSGANAKSRTMQMGIVGKESVEGKEGYWMQMVIQSEQGQVLLSKMLMGGIDFQPYRMIIQSPGQPAMEMPMNMANSNRGKMAESMQDWHSVGTETITVPAGTFSCEHWRNDKTGGDVWTSDKVTPFGMVKEVGKDHSMVLTKVLTDFPDRITGPVQKFDPQMMMQQMQQGRQPQP